MTDVRDEPNERTAARVAVAERAARAGGEVALESFRETLDIETKGDKNDVVTAVDREAQRRVVDVLREAFPDDPVVAEEAGEGVTTAVPEAGPAWVVDPVDGTANYVRGTRLWATSVAAVRDGEPVAAANVVPAQGDAYVADPREVRLNGRPLSVSERTDPETFAVVPMMWWGLDRRGEYAAATRETVERFGDLRRFGSAQATLSYVASGGIEGAFTNVDPLPWDALAGVAMVRRAGGRVTDLAGERWRHDARGLVASNGTAHEELLAAARAVEDERTGST